MTQSQHDAFGPNFLPTEHPGQSALGGGNPGGGVGAAARENFLHNPALFIALDHEADMAGGIDERIGKGDAPALEFRHEILGNAARLPRAGPRAGKEGGGMAIRAQAEQEQIVPVARLLEIRGEEGELRIVGARRFLGGSSPRMRKNSPAGMGTASNKVSRAMRKLLCSSSGGTQRSSPKVMRRASHGRREVAAIPCKRPPACGRPERARRKTPRSAMALRPASSMSRAASRGKGVRVDHFWFHDIGFFRCLDLRVT